jgi:hypothetical protein
LGTSSALIERLVCAGLTLSLTLACAPRATEGKPESVESHRYSHEGFSVTVPGGLSVRKTSPASDFDLLEFVDTSRTSQALLHAYVGNHPRFPRVAPADAKIDSVELGDLGGQSVRWQEPSGVRSREIILRLQPSRDWPAVVHFWYQRLNTAEAETADGIISSLDTEQGDSTS